MLCQVPAWKGGTGEGRTLSSALHVPDARLTGTVSEEYATFGPHYKALHVGKSASQPVAFIPALVRYLQQAWQFSHDCRMPALSHLLSDKKNFSF